VRRYPSIAAAAAVMNCTEAVLGACCRNERGNAYGFKWRHFRSSNFDFDEDEVASEYVHVKDLLLKRYEVRMN
jgi:hypothetical protein